MQMWRTRECQRQLGDHCSSSSTWHMLLCGSPVYKGNSRPIKHSHSHWSLHPVIHFVTFAVCIQIWTNEITPVLILYLRVVIAFTFVIRICITHKWNLRISKDSNFWLSTWESCAVSVNDSGPCIRPWWTSYRDTCQKGIIHLITGTCGEQNHALVTRTSGRRSFSRLQRRHPKWCLTTLLSAVH